MYQHISECIAATDKDIARRLAATPGAMLTTVPGIGCNLAAALYAEIGDPARERCLKRMTSYAGLVARLKQTGGPDSGSLVGASLAKPAGAGQRRPYQQGPPPSPDHSRARPGKVPDEAGLAHLPPRLLHSAGMGKATQRDQILKTIDEMLRRHEWEQRDAFAREDAQESARQAAAVLPSADTLDKILRYETTLDWQLYRAMNELERQQRRRQGEAVPPPLTMEVSPR